MNTTELVKDPQIPLGYSPYELSAPIAVLLELTYNCNLRCKHCMADNSGASYVGIRSLPVIAPGEFTTDQWLATIDELADAGVLIVYLSGGEPMMHPGFSDILQRVHDRGMMACLLTTATKINESNIDLIAAHCQKVEANLDGPDAESYDYFRGVKGAFEDTLSGIRLLTARNIPTRVNITVTKLTAPYISDIVDLAIELGLKEVVAVPLRISGRAQLFRSKLEMNDGEIEEFFNNCRRIRSTAPTDFLFLFEGEEEFESVSDPNQLMPRSGCGKVHCTITPEGNVKLEPETPNGDGWFAGSLTMQPFTEIWQEANIFKVSRNLSLDTNETCPYRMLGGSCFAHHGDGVDNSDQTALQQPCSYCNSTQVNGKWC
ncbi:MAG: radical SAM protein [Corynebacterium sp.]|nr:radical SAM protein [Corynebacterium sp.]